VRAHLAGLWLLPSTVVTGTAVSLSLLVSPSRRLVKPLASLWCRSVLGVAGVRVEVAGLERVGGRGPYVFAMNHQSNLDSLCVTPHLPADRFAYIAKRSLFWVPFLGWGMLAAGFVSVDRKNRARAVASLERAGERIRAGTSLVVYPEGTRSPDGRLQPFKKGPFHVALAAGVPIVPVAISGTAALMPVGSAAIRAGTVRLRFGAPIPVEADDTVERLQARTWEAMAELLPREATGRRPNGAAARPGSSTPPPA
jgi:1-acyl-sn-glycerol-3-phosphate acyltransferase